MSKANDFISQREKEFADMIIAAIEKGVDVWDKGWHNTQGFPIPHNPTTGTIYKQINSARLAVASLVYGWDSVEFMTFNQVKELDGFVKAGEKATKVTFVYFLNKKDEEELAKMSEDSKKKYFDEYNKLSPAQKEEFDEKGYVFIARAFPVFNIAQCRDINLTKLNELRVKNKIPTPEEFEKLQFIENPFVEKIIENSGIRFEYGGDRAYYVPTEDYITLPPRENFKSVGAFYATALHELGHATGHSTRLNRDLMRGIDDKTSYALEELKAETFSLIQCFDLGIEHKLENHAHYLDFWAKRTGTQDGKDEIRKAVKDALEIQKFVKANWYPKDMKLENSLTRGLNKENSQENSQTKPQSQELKAKTKIASKALSNANQKQAYYGR